MELTDRLQPLRQCYEDYMNDHQGPCQRFQQKGSVALTQRRLMYMHQINEIVIRSERAWPLANPSVRHC